MESDENIVSTSEHDDNYDSEQMNKKENYKGLIIAAVVLGVVLVTGLSVLGILLKNASGGIDSNTHASIEEHDEKKSDTSSENNDVVLDDNNASSGLFKREAKIKMKKETKYYYRNGELKSSYYEFEYDEEGNNIKGLLVNEFGNIDSWCEYSYDESNNMIKETYYNSDGSIKIGKNLNMTLMVI